MKWFFVLLGLLLVACGGETAVSSPPKSEAIACTVAYRAGVSQPIEREESIAFGDSDSEQTVAFTDLEFHAAYSAGELNNERALRVWVTSAGDETAVFHSTLYQLNLNSGPQNQFVGGHGFTGLNYSYHPTSGAEMQFWCEAN
ncbi:MAG: hypothetical protein DWQ04_06920 [Chloroflexi bacterium]|nr:MAG: hypothetical protein DWQ04_06920 [Chloroflexota bacterium]